MANLPSDTLAISTSDFADSDMTSFEAAFNFTVLQNVTVTAIRWYAPAVSTNLQAFFAIGDPGLRAASTDIIATSVVGWNVMPLPEAIDCVPGTTYEAAVYQDATGGIVHYTVTVGNFASKTFGSLIQTPSVPTRWRYNLPPDQGIDYSGVGQPGTSADWFGVDIVAAPTVPDTTPPTTPIVTVVGTTALSAHLTWTSTDDKGVTGAQVRLNGGTAQPTSGVFSTVVIGLISGATYSAEVRTRDKAGNWSAWSSPVSFRTAAVASGMYLGNSQVAASYLGSDQVTAF